MDSTPPLHTDFALPGTHPERPLKIAFWEPYADPEDLDTFSGIPGFAMRGLRVAGQEVYKLPLPAPLVKRIGVSLLWHFYNRILKKNFVMNRHKALTQLMMKLGDREAREALAPADAVITTSIAGVGFLQTYKPIFIIHDATWAQILEMYPFFYKHLQPKRVVRDGFEMERDAFLRPNVHLVLASNWVAQRAMADYPLDPRRVHVQPMGANFMDDPPRAEVESAIHARSGNRCDLLFVGREFARKGGNIAVDATIALRAQGIDATLHIVGCQPNGLPEFVKIHGYFRKDDPDEYAQLQRLYATSDFFLLPTRAEAQGIVFNEAAAYGLPAIATDVGGVSSVVLETWGKLLALDATGDEYAAWIANTLRDRPRYLQLAMAARDDYECRLSRSVYSRFLIKIISEAVASTQTLGGKVV